MEVLEKNEFVIAYKEKLTSNVIFFKIHNWYSFLPVKENTACTVKINPPD
jgi:hypothetical protein